MASDADGGRLSRREFSLLLGAVSVAACGGEDDPAGPPAGSGGSSGRGGAGGSGGAAGSGATLPEGKPWEQDPVSVPEDALTFPRTVLAGDMTSERVVFAIYVPDGQPKTLRVWREADQRIVREVQATPDADGFVKEVVDGLSPGTWFEYAFFSGQPGSFSARSLLGRVLTLPSAGDMRPLTFAFGSCVGRGTVLPDYADPDDLTPFEWAITDMAQNLEFDLFVHLGDQGYMDEVWAAGGSYQQYLAAWGAYHGGGFRKVYPKAGLVCTWDDHEVTDNGTVEPFTTDPEERAKINDAMRAYYRVMPLVSDDPKSYKLWRSFRFGDTVELILLDCRYELMPEEDGRLISDAQMDWLLSRIADSPCRFICIGTDKPFSNITLDGGDDYPGQAERWQGHLGDRDRVTQAIAAQGRGNVFFVTGDVHMNYVGTIDAGATTLPGSAIEVCTTSGNINPLADFLNTEQFEFRARPPHMPLLTFDPAAGTATVRMYATDGTLAFERSYTPVA